jgi:hypothetical protein
MGAAFEAVAIKIACRFESYFFNVIQLRGSALA